jgi:uncharacterized protein YoxC
MPLSVAALLRKTNELQTVCNNIKAKINSEKAAIADDERTLAEVQQRLTERNRRITDAEAERNNYLQSLVVWEERVSDQQHLYLQINSVDNC